MKRLVYIIFLLISLNNYASVSMQIEASRVQIGSSFRLVLTLDGSEANEVPDLTALQADFQIVGTDRSANYTILNGQATAINQWTVYLVPTRVGKITIPAIPVGPDRTQPTTIEVVANSGSSNSTLSQDEVQGKPQDIKMTARVDNRNVFVNQQIIYTVKLYNRLQLLDTSFEPPKISNALLVPLGDSKQYQSEEQGHIYAVLEQRYAIFPQKSGAFTIKSPVFNALIYDDMPHKVKVTAKPAVLQVKPAPTKTDSNHAWLPAIQVRLEEQYDRQEQSFQQGETFIRHVTLEAVGVPGQLLPQLNFATQDNFSIYPEKGKIKNFYREPNLVGSSSYKLTYLLDKSGQITIPELKVYWFNTQTKKEEVATLPPRIIHVNSLKSDSKVSNTQQKQIIQNPTPSNSTDLSQPNTNFYALLALFFAVAWFITVLLWLRSKKKPSYLNHKQQLKRLEHACRINDPVLAQQTLIDWAKCQWPRVNIMNLGDICLLLSDMKLKKQINDLAQALYHQQGPTWSGEGLWESIKNAQMPVANKKVNNDILPPIHPGAEGRL